MASIGNTVTASVLAVLTAPGTMDLKVNELARVQGARGEIARTSIVVLNGGPELVERTAHARYPALHIYCDRLTNSLKEKFRVFSGTAHVTVEVRYSQDRLEGMDGGLQAFTDAVCQLLDLARGDWKQGTYYAGGYDVAFATVKAAGQGFLQVAKIGFEVEVSRSRKSRDRMSTYIASNANRWYCQVESSYGQVPAVTAQNRIPAVKLTAKVTPIIPDRKDKSGSRTFPGQPSGGRQETSFTLKTYMTGSANAAVPPSYGPLFRAAMGSAPLLFAGGLANGAGTSGGTVGFAQPHGLQANQALTFNGEIRFVAAVVDATTVLLNAPFGVTPASGSALGATVTYGLAAALPSVSVFDYWSPSTALQRILCGGVIDKFSRSPR